MRLNEAIKQNKYKNEHHRLMLNLLYTSGMITASQTRFFKSFGLSPQQYNVLRILRGQLPNPANLGLVQERMLDQMSNASRLVEKLKVKKLVSRKASAQDRRQIDLLITAEGLELLSKIDDVFDDYEKGKSGLTEKEAQQLNSLLDKLNDQWD